MAADNVHLVCVDDVLQTIGLFFAKCTPGICIASFTKLYSLDMLKIIEFTFNEN